MEHYQRSADNGKEDLDSDIIRLIQLIVSNKLLYPVSVSDWTGPEHGVFWILIDDLNSRSAQVGFSLLSSSHITTVTDMFVMFYRFTVNVTILIYQHCFYSYYC